MVFSSRKIGGTAALARSLAAFALVCGMLVLAPVPARAATLEELTAEVEAQTEAYDAASERVQELEGQIDETQARIDELDALMPGYRQSASTSIRTLYKMQQSQGGIVQMLLSASDFNELLTMIGYLDIIQERNLEGISELVAAAEELERTQGQLDAQLAEAEATRQEAADALAEARAARTALQQQIAEQAAAEEEERAAAIAAARAALEAAAAVDATDAAATADAASATTDADADDGSGSEATSAASDAADSSASSGSSGTFTTATGQEVQIEVPSSSSIDTVEVSDEEQFVSTWTDRLNAYLAGSPLAGYGQTFAEAAWAYGCDPRLSAAISCVESSKGLYCFKPYNAWGWGSASWSSWEEAIWAHAKGLASGYGGTLTYAGAQKYCPPNADFWYARVLAEMEKI